MIQEELLKDVANRSEMSDWFNREDAPKSAAPLATRPNPKNVQNAAKIEELEQQIKRYGPKKNVRDFVADKTRVPGCKQSDSHLKDSSDHRQYPAFLLNGPNRKLRLLQSIRLSSHPPMLKYSTH